MVLDLGGLAPPSRSFSDARLSPTRNAGLLQAASVLSEVVVVLEGQWNPSASETTDEGELGSKRVVKERVCVYVLRTELPVAYLG